MSQPDSPTPPAPPAPSAGASAPSRSRRKPRGPGAGSIVLVVLLAAAYFIPRGPMWNADTHLFLTASIVDRGRLDIDPYASYTGDRAESAGHYYSDKAPGLSLLAVPVYVVVKYSLLGGKSYLSLFAVPESQRLDFLPRYLLALVFAGLPTGLLAALLYSFLARLGLTRPWRALLALTYGLGTIALPFASVFFSHQMAALLVFGAFVVLYRIRHQELDPRWSLLAGGLAGYAVITEYPTAIIVVALSLYALADWSGGRQSSVLLAAGALPSLVIAAIYNTLAFGSPVSQGYAHLAGPSVYRTGQAQGFMGITYPHLDALWQTTFGPYRGLFLLSPVLLLAIPGFVLLWRRSEWRAELWLWLGLVLAYFTFVVSYFEWDGGFSLGPRHFLPALPFLVLPIGELARPDRERAWRVATAALSAVSITVVGLATATGPLMDPRFDAPLTQWVLPSLAGASPNPAAPALAAQHLGSALVHAAPLFLGAQLDNNWGMLFGLPGALQLLPLLVAIGLVLGWRWWRAQVAQAAGTLAVEGSSVAPSTAPEFEPLPAPPDVDQLPPPAEGAHQDEGGGAPGPEAVPVRQLASTLAPAPPAAAARVRIAAVAVTAPWEQAILASAQQQGGASQARVRAALAAAKLALAYSQRLAIFKRIRTILLYGPLARGEDPYGEISLLIVCNPLKGPNAMENAFAELDTLARHVRDETQFSLRPLLVVRGQPERDVPGEPSWRDLARRGVVVYGEPV